MLKAFEDAPRLVRLGAELDEVRVPHARVSRGDDGFKLARLPRAARLAVGRRLGMWSAVWGAFVNKKCIKTYFSISSMYPFSLSLLHEYIQ